MKKLLFVYGGKSVEHDISIITSLQVMKIAEKNYDIIPVYVDRNGAWWTGKNLQKSSIYADFHRKVKRKRRVFACFGQGCFLIGKRLVSPDVAIVCSHGINGEDGSVSAILEQVGIPYSCSSILSSAITMDKAVTKIILKNEGILNPEFVTLKRGESFVKVLENIEFPVIVKPANLGSSVGIGVAKTEIELREKAEVAFNFDDKILVEKFLTGSREFNCACFKYKDKLFTSKVFEVSKGDFFTFEEKYLKESEKNKIEIDEELKSKIIKLTKKTYSSLDCFGIVRVDFLFKDDTLYVNEVNNIPGALSCYMFEEKFDEILDLLVDESIRRFENKKRISYSFNSDALKVFEKEQDAIVVKK